MINKIFFRRKKYLIIPEFQLKYSFYISFILILFVLIAEYFIFRSLSNVLPSIYSTKVANILKYSRIVFTLVGVFYIVIIAILSIYFSHRVAGPIFRLKKEIDQVGINKGVRHKFYLRKNDELKDVVNSINLMFERVDVQISELQIILNSLKKDLADNNPAIFNEKIDNLLNKIEIIKKGI